MTRFLCVALLAVTTGLIAPAALRAAPITFTDPTGDNGSAPDIGVVSVTMGADGYFHVRPEVANQPALGTEGAIVVGFDTDRSLTTGSRGRDYAAVFTFQDMALELLKWDGSAWESAPTAEGDVRALVGSSGFELLVRPAALGNVTSFQFEVSAGSGAESQVDWAPNEGMWLYEPQLPAPTVERVDATWVPNTPKAGSVFQPGAVRLELSDGKSVLADSYRCVAELGGKLLRGKGRGGCVFTLPRTARGKRLKVTMLVTYKGDTTEFEPYVFKVR